MKGLCILGSTGSIGVNTLDVAARHPEKYKIIALSANSQVERLAEQCEQYQPEFAVMANENAAEQLTLILKNKNSAVKVLSGIDGLETIASLKQVDYVMAAIVGAAGLKPSLAAARSGKRILLANKEALVMSGQLFMDEVKKNNAELLPIDSEHNAIFQCMPEDYNNDLSKSGITKILLTGSGGPFRTKALNELENVTPDQACAHPNWSMGRKISVDSATMMNKGLEIIEACWLFNTTPDNIQVVVHPQSIIHSMVQYSDGSVLAQLGQPDMRTPIAHALSWPERIESGVEKLDFFSLSKLEFEQPDYERFPCLRLAEESIRKGGTAPAILNAANEVAVASFLDNELKFTDIPYIIEQTLLNLPSRPANSLDEILEDDLAARKEAEHLIILRVKQAK
ncbi:MAG: 1-deoxy-D-xylulose-5-phosphate reductoisomerase [Gammaproteobacteria bacterium]|nr:1-deoxy-D-xylulose-5-phosphate reductoisomerase [Gammaproteobacteria bacterium]MCW8988300.1 1-deoxy-D-xylulose-5-phosphate reductoisomerase [Gammaproteobacteria bacterium]MCW9031951.1 1-deoxy-D-xylulose-5-phosphate reductoisomerase [Gammaproteobacteria bacterium]